MRVLMLGLIRVWLNRRPYGYYRSRKLLLLNPACAACSFEKPFLSSSLDIKTMQDPLKTNKPFQTAYSTRIQEHNRFLTPHNIDDLILKLTKMETDCSQRPTEMHYCNQPAAPPSQNHPIPVIIPTADSTNSNNVLFSDRYMQKLPVNSEQERKRIDETNWWSATQPHSNHSSSINNNDINNNSTKRLQYRLAPIDKTKLTGLSPSKSHNNIDQYRAQNILLISPHKKTNPVNQLLETAPRLLNTNESIQSTNQKMEVSNGREQLPAVIGDSHKSDININLFICKPKPVSSVDPFTDNNNNDIDSDDERDSGWNESEQWMGLEEEEEDMLSAIDDDDSDTILTNTSGMGMEELESDWSSDMIAEHDSDVVMSQSMLPEVVSWCGPIISGNDTGSDPIGLVRSIGTVSTLVIPSRSINIGERGGVQATPPLTPSLFPGRPPTIHFPLKNEKYDSLKAHQKSLLKWRMSSITPNVVKHVIARVGFKATNSNKWIGYWGKHMTSEAFRTIKANQKVNHFPGSFNLGRKDRLWRNLFRMQAHFGKKEFDFIPETYILPNDMRHFKKVWENSNSYNNTKKISKWIIKPPASARGIGIKVINKWSQIPKKRPVIVQRYISDPFLINGSKFDLRIYVYITSFDPLIIYIYQDGLVRFATVKYSKSTKKLSNRYMHLTNYSVNKHSSEFISNSDETQCIGHKWGLLALWGYMSDTLSIDPGPVWERIKDVVIKTVISCESHITSLIKANVRHKSCVHELFGFDIMLDKHLKPWLLEVNVSPSLHSNSSLDLNIKEVMMRDVFNMCRFILPVQNESSIINRGGLTTDEKLKHSKYLHCKLHSQQVDVATILDNLSNDDYNVLMDFEDEFSRRGGFIRVFPQLNSYSLYTKYFQIQHYYNILIDQWITKYKGSPHLGIVELRKHFIKKHTLHH